MPALDTGTWCKAKALLVKYKARKKAITAKLGSKHKG